MTISTFVRADRLRLATLFQSKEETRYYLNGVHVRAAGNGVRVAATDGVRMAIFHDSAGFTSAECIIAVPKAAVDAIKRCKQKEFCWFGIIGDHNGTGRHEARIFNTSDSAGGLDEAREAMEDITHSGVIWAGAVDLIDGTFPDISAVLPAKIAATAPAAAFNTICLKDFGEVAKDAQGKDGLAAVCVYSDGVNPALVDCGRQDFVGVIMPVRFNDGLTIQSHHAHAPAWALAA